MKVLIADDNEDARAILKRTLAHDGHETETARNGVEALEKTRADPPDLIISDILMPEMDGFKLCGEIKSSPALKQIPFVFYTATYLDEKDAQLALDLGASRYIAKPLAPDAFLEMIQEVMAECKAGVLPVPDKPKEKTSVLFGMYEESVSAKLEKKVAELSLYQKIFFHSKNAVAILDRDGFYMEQNPAHRALTGYSDAELRGKTPAVHLGEAVFANILNQLSEKGVYRGELLGGTKSGKKTEIELFSFPIRDHKGRVSCYVGIERDLTEQNRAKRLESEQRRVLELITRGETSLTGIFERITEVAEAYCPDVRGSILILEGGIVRHGAAPSMPSAYNALLEGLEVGPKAGSCGTAMYRKARVVVSDIRTDPLWEGYRDLGEEYGFRACWSQPILGVDQNVLGAFALYREQPGGPDADEIRLIESMSHLAGLAIERKQAETKIRTLSQTVEQSPVSVIITDTDGNIEYVNSTFEKVSGYTAEEVIGRNPRLLKSGGTPKNRYQALWRAITRGKSWEGELLNRKKNGEAFWESVHIAPVLDESGVIQHYLAVKEDITLRKKQEERLLHQAHFDPLTDLPNRFLSLDRLSQLLKEAERVDCQVAVMFVDLDDFKKVNDTLGHEAGDTLLLEAAERLRTVVRNGDTVGRLGGDEFIVLLGGLSDAADTRPVATGILERFKRPFNINGRKIRLSATVGIAVYPEDGGTPSEMLRCADSAMYHAKGLGRNTFAYFTHAMNRALARRLALEEQMQEALDRGEFTVVYQPQVEVRDGRVIGAEALLRWNNPKLGPVSPGEFIPLAEQTGLIEPLGQFVLTKALDTAARWPRPESKLRMAVNLSPRQFRDTGLVGYIENALRQSGVPADCLELEITEGVLMSGHADVDQVLAALSRLGVSIAMDDFGTGYSSLSYLRTYPFDVLKIDSTFVRDITVDPGDRALILGAISMAHGLNLKVLAEGVETEAQLAELKSLNCDCAQGYLFGKPMPEDDFFKWTEDR